MENKWAIIGLLAALGLVLFFGHSADAAVSASMDTDSFTRYDALIRAMSRKWNVPWRWLKYILIVESNQGQAASVARGLADPTDVDGSVSFDGLSWGLFQLTLATAKGLTGREVSPVELNDPTTSADLAGQLVRQLLDRFGIDDPESVFRAYNGGPKFGAATIPYYAKIQSAKLVVMNAQPGDDTEIA